MEENRLPENTEPKARAVARNDNEENDAGDDKKYTPCPFCGNFDFCTQPNSYDTYEIHKGKLAYVRSENTHDKFAICCRACGQEFPLTDAMI